jgi:hypothetical protein
MRGDLDTGNGDRVIGDRAFVSDRYRDLSSAVRRSTNFQPLPGLDFDHKLGRTYLQRRTEGVR